MTTDQAIQQRFVFRGRNRNLPWYPRRGVREDLMKLLGDLGFNEGVEVGTQRGYFAEYMCKVNPKLHLSCVDPWMGYHEQPNDAKMNAYYEEAKKRLAPHNVTIMRAMSMEAVDSFADGSLDFVYIDGCHTFDYVIQDLVRWTPKVKKGGVVAGHDFHPAVGADIHMAVYAYTHCHHIDPWYVTREIWPSFFWVQR